MLGIIACEISSGCEGGGSNQDEPEIRSHEKTVEAPVLVAYLVVCCPDGSPEQTGGETPVMHRKPRPCMKIRTAELRPQLDWIEESCRAEHVALLLHVVIVGVGAVPFQATSHGKAAGEVQQGCDIPRSGQVPWSSNR